MKRMIGMIVGTGHLGMYLSRQLDWPLYPSRLEDLKTSDCKIADIVLNAAGKTDLLWCEQNQDQAKRDNVFGAISAAHAAFAAGSRFVQLSSGCVWDGPYRSDGKAFNPENIPTPACFYAETKVMADEQVRIAASGSGGTWASLRLRMPYSSVRSPRNLFTKLCSYPNLIDEPNSITSADTLLETIEHLAAHFESPLWNRISCVYDRGVTTPFAIGQMLNRAGLRDYPRSLAKQKLDEWHKPKRVNTVMYDRIFEQAVGPPQVQDELERVIAAYKENR